MNIFNLLFLWKPFIEIITLWFLIYQVMLFFEGTRAIQVLRGIIVIVIAFFLFQRLNFEVLDWLFTKMFAISVLAILVIFHPEIRQGLARLGRRHIFGAVLKPAQLDSALEQIALACGHLSKDKIGALIVVEKNDSLAAYIESGVFIDAIASYELMEAIFSRSSILHDGGLILQQSRIAAAGCIFPLSENMDLNRIFGTRHRAALGLSEETDAIIIVVSEERQDISLIYKAKMHYGLNPEDLISKIKEIISGRN